MSEIVQRVTTAIEELNIILDDGDSEKIARAAISAMREPTPEMIKAGNEGWVTSRGVFCAMIDEALK